MHNVDLFLDITYIATVPVYHWSITLVQVISLACPIIYIIFEMRTYGFFVGLATYTGLQPLCVLCSKRTIKEAEEAEAISSMIFFILEDGPQFLVQMLNTLLIGRDQTIVQALSPCFSIYGISSRLLHL